MLCYCTYLRGAVILAGIDTAAFYDDSFKCTVSVFSWFWFSWFCLDRGAPAPAAEQKWKTAVIQNVFIFVEIQNIQRTN